MSSAFLFVDTDFLMEYKPIQDIDWAKHLGVDYVTILITPTVTRQLERHKTGDKRKRNRTIAATKLLNAIPDDCNTKEIRKNVAVQLIIRRYQDRLDYDLTDSEDDQILLNAIHFKDENKGEEVRILSGDKIFKLRMREYGIEPVTIDPDWRLDPVDDLQGKKIKELEKLASSLPELSVSFVDGVGQKCVTLEYPPYSDRNVLSQIKRKAESSSPLNAIAFNPLYSEQDGYANKRRIIEYLEKEYMPFVGRWLEFHQVEARRCPIHLKLSNSGGGPANHVRIRLEILLNSRFKVLTELQTEPLLPRAPTIHLNNQITGQSDAVYPAVSKVPQQNKVSGQAKVASSTKEITIQLDFLQHHDAIELPPFIVEFYNRKEAAGFSIKVAIVCNELSDRNEQTLNVQLVKEESSDLHLEVPMPYE